MNLADLPRPYGTHLLNSPLDRPRLRVGVMMDGSRCPLFAALVLHEIASCNFATLEIVIVNAGQLAVPAVRRPLPLRVLRLLTNRQQRSHLLFELYARLDAQGHRATGLVDPTWEHDCSALLADVPRREVRAIRKGFVDRFTDDDVAAIRDYRLDVILRFGFNILKGEVLRAARHGIWSFHHGDNDYYRGGPACFWEMWEGSPMTGTILQVLTEELDGGVVLCKGLFPTRSGLSWFANRLQPYWGAADFVVRKLRQVYEYGWDHVAKRAVPSAPYLGRRKLYRMPVNQDMVRWLVPAATRAIARRVMDTGRIPHWQLGISTRDPSMDDRLTPPPPDPNAFSWLSSPKGEYWADPFLFRHGEATWLFFEAFVHELGRGIVCCREITVNGLGPVLRCLERPYHLSYPQVFSHGGAIYMLPETLDNGAVELYRAVDFPNQWTFEKTLFSGTIVDTTVHISDTGVYFFATTQDPLSHAYALDLFHADSLTGEWRLHPASPLTHDVRFARGAGAILLCGGRLFRPSQDCSKRYGYALSLNEITRLDVEDYHESCTWTIGPDQFRAFAGIHSYARDFGFEVIDGCRLLKAREVAS